MVTPQQPNYYPPPPPGYEVTYEEKIKRKIESAKRNNKLWLLVSILWGALGVSNIVLHIYTRTLFSQLEMPLGVIFLILCFSSLYNYLTKREVRMLEKCLSPTSAIDFYKKQIKKMFYIAVGGVIILILCLGSFQFLSMQKPLLYQLTIIGIVMVIMGVALSVYFRIKIKECQKYI